MCWIFKELCEECEKIFKELFEECEKIFEELFEECEKIFEELCVGFSRNCVRSVYSDHRGSCAVTHLNTQFFNNLHTQFPTLLNLTKLNTQFRHTI